MLPSTIYCDSCGAANRLQATFCFSCGQFLHTSTAIKFPSSSATGLLNYSTLLKQRYRIIAQIGKGGFGAVYKAADTQFGNRLVAIKEMSQSGLTPQELQDATEAFKREANLLANLTHPNLPRIYEQFPETGRWYLVMDFIEGETLETYLTRAGGKLPLEKVLDLGIQICTVLGYLHTRQPPIIFRDLKPANIMLNLNGHLYLIDFGIARHFKPGQIKDTTALGSTGYAAPEQYGKAQTTPRTDIYSLGATLHQLLTGNDPSDSPFNFAPLQLPGQTIPPGLDILIRDMLNMDVNKRPASASIVKHSLQHIAAQYLATKTRPKLFGVPQTYQPIGTPPPSMPALTRTKQPNIQPQSNTLHICNGHSSRITALSWSPKGTHLASASYDKKVQIWDAITGQKTLTYRGHSTRIHAVAWSPDGTYIASAGDDGIVHVWDATTGKSLSSYQSHSQAVNALAWSPDSTRIASASDDKTVHVWSAAIGMNLFTYRGHTASVLTVTWSPDGQRLASGGEDKKVQIWNPVKESKKLFTLFFNVARGQFTYNDHLARVNAVTWSPDGKRLASASSDKSTQIWDVATGKKYFISRNPSAAINALSWSPTSKRLASASNDKTVQVWDVFSRNSISTYHGHTGYVTAVAWSPDGKCIASGSVDHTVQIWKVI